LRPKDIHLSKTQIREFLNRLAGDEGCQFNGFEWRCGSPQFTYAKKILTLMKIPKAEQEKFLELCKEYGGYCDCEICVFFLQSLLHLS